MSAVPQPAERRDGFERRDERRQQTRWPEVDRRQAEARRHEDREHACGESFGRAPTVADRNPTLHPLFASILGAHGA